MNIKKINNFILMIGFFLLTACNPSISDDQRRQNDLIKQHVKTNPELINVEFFDNKIIPLHYAVLDNQLSLAKWLLKKGADINVNDRSSKTPLHFSMIWGDIRMIKLLLSTGADVNAKTDYGDTPLHIASSFGKTEIADLLLRKGANPNAPAKRGETPFHYAARNKYDPKKDQIGTVARLIEYKGDINVKDNSGSTPLHSAISFDNTKMMAFLIDHGANINGSTKSGLTPLHLAAISGYSEAAKLLISRGADLNLKDAKNWTPLERARLAPAMTYLNGRKVPVDTTEVIKLLENKDVN